MRGNLPAPVLPVLENVATEKMERGLKALDAHRGQDADAQVDAEQFRIHVGELQR